MRGWYPSSRASNLGGQRAAEAVVQLPQVVTQSGRFVHREVDPELQQVVRQHVEAVGTRGQ